MTVVMPRLHDVYIVFHVKYIFTKESHGVLVFLFVSVGSMKKCAETKPDFLKPMWGKNQKSSVGILSLSNSLKFLCCQFQVKPTVEISVSDERL